MIGWWQTSHGLIFNNVTQFRASEVQVSVYLKNKSLSRTEAEVVLNLAALLPLRRVTNTRVVLSASVASVLRLLGGEAMREEPPIETLSPLALKVSHSP